jgi:hypothetical protein
MIIVTLGKNCAVGLHQCDGRTQLVAFHGAAGVAVPLAFGPQVVRVVAAA